MQSLEFLNWPIMRELHPNVLVRGVEGQTLLITGEGLKFSHHIVARYVNLSNGFRQEIASLSDTEMLLQDLPVLPISQGGLTKIEVTLDLMLEPATPSLDLFIVD